MGTRAHRLRELERWPKYKAGYIRAFDRMIQKAAEDGRPCREWKTGEEVMEWWLNPKSNEQVDDQTVMFE